MNSLVTLLEKNTPDGPTEEEEKDSVKTLADAGQDTDEEEDYYLEYSDSNHIY